MNKDKIISYHKQGLALRRLNGKRPAFKGAFDKGDKLAELLSWSDNIGILTGRVSGVICVDVDRHGELDGVQTLSYYLLENKVALPTTRVIKSPNDGYHYYYKLPDKYNEARFYPNIDEIKGVDFRNHGQFMVAEESEIDGRLYEVISDVPFSELPDAPQWLLDLYLKDDGSHEIANDEPTFIANKMMEWQRGANEGFRNIWLTRQVGFLFRQRLPIESIYYWANIINVNFIKPPLEQEEINAMIGTIARAEAIKKQRKENQNEKDKTTN